MEKFEYKKSIELKGDIHDIVFKLTDFDEMKKWQLNLTEVQLLEGTFFKTGMKCMLHYHAQSHHVEMLQTILEQDLPNSFNVEYEVQGVKNRCINTFEKADDHVLWSMDVYFEFENEPPLPQSMFEDQTFLNMMLFKQYLEI